MEITFDELSISRDSKILSVEATVTNEGTEEFVITNISVDTCATFNEMVGHPSSKPIVSQDFSAPEAALEVTDNDIFKNKILFVWVTASDGYETYYEMKPLINWFCVYQKAMCYVKHIPCNNCKPPVGFIDFILKVKGLQYSLYTENYSQAIKIWKSLYAKKGTNLDSSDCGCH